MRLQTECLRIHGSRHAGRLADGYSRKSGALENGIYLTAQNRYRLDAYQAEKAGYIQI